MSAKTPPHAPPKFCKLLPRSSPHTEKPPPPIPHLALAASSPSYITLLIHKPHGPQGTAKGCKQQVLRRLAGLSENRPVGISTPAPHCRPSSSRLQLQKYKIPPKEKLCSFHAPSYNQNSMFLFLLSTRCPDSLSSHPAMELLPARARHSLVWPAETKYWTQPQCPSMKG